MACRRQPVCRIFARFLVRSCSVFLPACPSHLDHERSFGIISRLDTKMFNAGMVIVAEVVKAQTVGLFIHDCAQFVLKLPALRSVEQTLKDRVLHALPIVYALPGDLTQTTSAAGIFRIYIIGDHYQHCQTSFPQKRRIGIQIVPQISCQQQCLHIRNQSPGDLLLQIGVRDRVALARLPRLQEFLSPCVRQ